MQMYSSDHRGYKEDYYSVVEEDYIFKDEYTYNKGSTMQMMPHQSQPNHNYNQNQGHVYGGYNDCEKKGHVAQYSAPRYQEDRRHDGWGVKNDQYGHGGGYGAHQGHYGNHREGMNHGAAPHQGHYGNHREGMNYGAAPHQGHYGYPEQRKKVSAWEFKGIVD